MQVQYFTAEDKLHLWLKDLSSTHHQHKVLKNISNSEQVEKQCLLPHIPLSLLHVNHPVNGGPFLSLGQELEHS